MDQQIKILSQFIGKPVKDWNEEDVTKIIASQNLRDNLLKIEIVEELINSDNEVLSEILTPVYIKLAYHETMQWTENQLKLYNEDPAGTKEYLLEQLRSNMESDGILTILASGFVLLKMFSEEVEIKCYEGAIRDSLKQLESICTLIPIPDGYNILISLLDHLYFPLIGEWYEQFKELLVEENPVFKAKLQEAGEFQMKIIENEQGEKK